MENKLNFRAKIKRSNLARDMTEWAKEQREVKEKEVKGYVLQF